MNAKFVGEDYLLKNNIAKKLYQKYAKDMPIFDYHCHLEAEDIYKDKRFNSITEVWLGGDHYKWRLMRAFGIPEKAITGSSTDEEKFMSWAKTIPYTIGNPLYNWSHSELRKYFGINEVLNEKSASYIYKKANEKMKSLTARHIILMSNVKVICTTDDPTKSLIWHEKLQKDSTFPVTILPAFRPDKGVNIERPWFLPWVKDLEEICHKRIERFEDFLHCLEERIDYFHIVGCRLSDHALDEISFSKASEEEVATIFDKAINKESISQIEIKKYKTFMMKFFGTQYAKRGWVQQYHIGALRDVSFKLFKQLGPDTGNDGTRDSCNIDNLAFLLNELDQNNSLPKTILYGLNPNDNEKLAVMAGCFQAEGIANKVQLGAAWWFNDQKDGINRQMMALSQTGLISKWVGMLTDSRCFLSYPRHDYFRRILCSFFGAMIETGEINDDLEHVGGIIQDICYNNAINYFNVPLKKV